MQSRFHSRVPRARHRAHVGIAWSGAVVLLLASAASSPEARAQSATKSAPTAKPSAKKGAAAKPATTRTGLETLEKQVREFTLANGLEFIVVGRHDAPVFSFATVVNTGAANDAIGTTGIAHMMEHMAFKGTEIVGTKNYAAEAGLLAEEEQRWQDLIGERRKGARADSTKLATLEASFKQTQERAREPVESNGYTRLIEQNGGRGVNAFTSNDVTAYYYSLPSNRLELWALLEGGRMAYPVFREFYKERDVVYEERRMRYESSPTGRLFLEFVTACYQAHPYGFGGIGFPSDLKTFSRTEGEEFYRRNYVAKNMCVALVGDVKEEEAKRLAETYWSALPDGPAPPPIDTVEPEQKAERRVILEDPAQPFIFIGWHCPAGTDPSYPAYQALGSLLGGGDFARLNKRLVKEKKIAVQVQAGTGFPGEKYPNLFYLVIVPAAGQDPLAVEQEAYAVLDEVKASGFTAEELDGFKVRTRAQKIGVAESNSSLALQLAQSQMMHGDWREWFRDFERAQAVRVEDLKAAMERTLRKSNRTVAMIVNAKPEAGAGGGR